MSKDYLAANQGDYPVYSSQTANEGMLGKIKTYDYDGEYLTWTTDGAYAGSVFYRKGKFSITNICGLLDLQSDKLLIKFLYYYLGNVTKNYVNAGMGNPKLMSNVMERIKVAVPPLVVQEEIVNILDSFTLLEAELEAELEARKKQYEHYREGLLSPVNMHGETKEVVLGDVCDFANGKGHEQFIVDSGKYVVVNSKFVSTNGEVRKFSDKQISPVFVDDILMVMSDLPNGKALAKCFLVDKNDTYTLNQRICRLSVKSKELTLPKYLYYVLNRTRLLLRYDNGCDQTNLRKEDILSIKIVFPSLAEQERIVGILDRFDALVNDISIGLPAELNARRQQYEYYRNKLLNFEPLAAT